MQSTEGTPLLADPPIDDDSYRYEARSFPSEEQRQLLFLSYGMTSTLSLLVETSMSLLLILTFQEDLVVVSLYCLAGVLTIYLEFGMHWLARYFSSRLRLLTVAIVQQRLAAVWFLTMVIGFNRGWFDKTAGDNPGLLGTVGGVSLFGTQITRIFAVTGIVLSTVWIRASLYLYQRAYRADWLMALASTQEHIRFRFEKLMRSVTLLVQVVYPVCLGILLLYVSVVDVAYLLIFVSVCGLLIEPSITYKLFRTCYVLYLPRNKASLDCIDYDVGSELRQIGGVWQPPTPSQFMVTSTSTGVRPAGQPLSRVYRYVRRRSIPVAITMGTLLITAASLIMVQPVTGWYFLRQGMNPLGLYVIKSIQALTTLHPALPARQSFMLAGGGALAALPMLLLSLHSPNHHLFWTVCFAASILVNRAGSPTIALVGDEFIKEYLVDEEVLKVYKENMMWLRIHSELALQMLTLVWPRKEQFFWPIFVSAILTLVGISMVLTMIRRHWGEIQHT